MPHQPLRIAVITISDRTAAGDREDLSGPLAARLLSEYGEVSGPIVVTDGVRPVREMISHAIFCDAQVVFTTGGTGITSRDLTPEATEPLITQRMWGIEQRMRDNPAVPTAAISRGIAGVATVNGKRAFVMNAPGSTGGVRDAVEAVGPLLAHIVDQMADGDHPAPSELMDHPSEPSGHMAESVAQPSDPTTLTHRMTETDGHQISPVGLRNEAPDQAHN